MLWKGHGVLRERDKREIRVEERSMRFALSSDNAMVAVVSNVNAIKAKLREPNVVFIPMHSHFVSDKSVLILGVKLVPQKFFF